jgi:hypothetical protein
MFPQGKLYIGFIMTYASSYRPKLIHTIYELILYDHLLVKKGWQTSLYQKINLPLEDCKLIQT